MPPARPRATTPEGREQRERILRAAIERFTAHGYRGTSLDAVAAAVGISRQGVLHYFPSKVHLLLGVLELRDEETAARAEARAREDGVAELRRGLLEAVAENQARPDLTRLYTVLSAESVAPEHLGHAHFQERYQTVRAAMSHAVREAQEAGELDPAIDPLDAAILLIAVMDGLQMQFLLEPETIDMVAPFSRFLDLLRAHVAGERSS
jgi:AcrR family transcriptional regulator